MCLSVQLPAVSKEKYFNAVRFRSYTIQLSGTMKNLLQTGLFLVLSLCSVTALPQIEFYMNDTLVDIGNSYSVFIIETGDTVYTYEGKMPTDFYKFNDDTSEVKLVFAYNGMVLKFIIPATAVECIKMISSFSIHYYTNASESWSEYIRSRHFAIMTCPCCNLSFIYDLEKE